jgi:hypothetical protein
VAGFMLEKSSLLAGWETFVPLEDAQPIVINKFILLEYNAYEKVYQ